MLLDFYGIGTMPTSLTYMCEDSEGMRVRVQARAKKPFNVRLRSGDRARGDSEDERK